MVSLLVTGISLIVNDKADRTHNEEWRLLSNDCLVGAEVGRGSGVVWIVRWKRENLRAEFIHDSVPNRTSQDPPHTEHVDYTRDIGGIVTAASHLSQGVFERHSRNLANFAGPVAR